MTTAKPNQPGTIEKAKPGAKPITKKAQLIRILKSKPGTDVTAVSRRLGWQNHTTPAALTGLRKAGYEIATEKPGGGKPTRYRITAEPKVGHALQDGASADAR